MYKNYGQYLYTQMESVYIETDYNMIGFDFFTNIKTDYFIKFEDLWFIPKPGYDLDDEDNEESIVDFEIQLTDKILTEKRSYS